MKVKSPTGRSAASWLSKRTCFTSAQRVVEILIKPVITNVKHINCDLLLNVSDREDKSKKCSFSGRTDCWTSPVTAQLL